jgi:hypothetical protein
MIDISTITGVWESKDFPMYNYNDGMVFTLFAEKNIVLWALNNGENITFADGHFSVIDNNDGSFNIQIEGVALEDKYLNLSAELYVPQNPPSIVVTVPEYGKRYFEKIR